MTMFILVTMLFQRSKISQCKLSHQQSNRCRKSIGQNLASIYDFFKNSQQTPNERELPYKRHLQKLTLKIILNDGRLNAFPLTLGTTQGCLL